jgi:hypothetical protein
VTFEGYTRHIDWSLSVGRRRTRQAASTLRELEGASAARSEEAIDDPLRMARCLLAGKAVTGIVTAAAGSHNHRNQVTAAHLDGH